MRVLKRLKGQGDLETTAGRVSVAYEITVTSNGRAIDGEGSATAKTSLMPAFMQAAELPLHLADGEQVNVVIVQLEGLARAKIKTSGVIPGLEM